MNRDLTIQQLLNLLTRRKGVQEPLKSILLEVEFLSPEQKQQLPSDIKVIYNHIFNPRSETINISEFTPFRLKKTKMPICCKPLSQFQSSYRCYDCLLHVNSVLCEKCFDEGNHFAHRFVRLGDLGGSNCNCGNSCLMKEEGFCKRHSGQVEEMKIEENKEQKFCQVFEYLFEWFFLLSPHKDQFIRYSAFLMKSLEKLNKESLFYNTLTSKLLLKKSFSNNTILYNLLRVTEKKVINNICSLLSKLFSLKDFKYLLLVELTIAYNTIDLYEQKEFHYLLGQLLGESELIRRLCEQKRMVPNPQNRRFNLMIILKDMSDATNLKREVALKYFGTYFKDKNGIKIYFMETLQKKVEEQGQSLLQFLYEILNPENLFYVTIEEILKTCHEDPIVVENIITAFYKQIASQKYTHKKNQLILPFHRAFSLALFAIINGNIQSLTFKKVAEIVDTEEQKVIKFFIKNLKIVLSCILQFAETFTKNSYFDNYNIVYLRSGCCIYQFDYLFVRIAACLFSNKDGSFDNFLLKFYSQKKEEFDEQKRLKKGEEIRKWIAFLAMINELIISDNIEISFLGILQMKNEQLEEQCDELRRKVFKFSAPFEPKYLKQIQKYLIGNLNEQKLNKYLYFDKKNIKYKLKCQINDKPINFEYYYSLHKMRQEFPNSKFTSDFDENTPILNSKNKRILNVLKTESIAEILFEEILSLKNEKEYRIINGFQKELKKLIQLKIQNGFDVEKQRRLVQNLNELEKKMIKPQPEGKGKLSNLKLERMKQMKEKREQFLEKASRLQTEEKVIDAVCMICKEEKQNSPICYLAYCCLSNSFEFKIQSYVFQSFFQTCSHTVHYSCCIKEGLNLQCPLCKNRYNILIPLSNEIVLSNVESAIIQKMVSILPITFSIVEYSQEAMNKLTVIEKVCIAFTEMIGHFSIKEKENFKYKQIYFVNALYVFIKRLWDSLQEEEKLFLQNHVRKELDKNLKPCQLSKSIIKNIKHCIYSTVFTRLLLPQAQNPQEIFDLYRSKINQEDLSTILQNLYQSIDLSDKINLLFDKNKANQLPRVTTIMNNFYDPPNDAAGLLRIRSEANPKCRSNHIFGYCVICQAECCKDCFPFILHAEYKHAGQGLFFSPTFGELIYISRTENWIVSTLYENSIGEKWEPSKKVEGFYCETEQYRIFCEKFLTHGLYNYINETFNYRESSPEATDLIIVEGE